MDKQGAKTWRKHLGLYMLGLTVLFWSLLFYWVPVIPHALDLGFGTSLKVSFSFGVFWSFLVAMQSLYLIAYVLMALGRHWEFPAYWGIMLQVLLIFTTVFMSEPGFVYSPAKPLFTGASTEILVLQLLFGLWFLLSPGIALFDYGLWYFIIGKKMQIW